MNDSNVDFTKVTKIAVIVEPTTFDRNKEICSALFETKVYSKLGITDDIIDQHKRID